MPVNNNSGVHVQVAKQFDPEQAKQNIQTAGKAVTSFAESTGMATVGVAASAVKSTAALALSIKGAHSCPSRLKVPFENVSCLWSVCGVCGACDVCGMGKLSTSAASEVASAVWCGR